MKIRRQRKQSATPSVMAPDSQSVRWGNRRSDNGFDA
ncbi:MAG: DDE transposase, partial [Bacteroides sp.]|nr:DDE transposase [Bacteroides sp.]